MSSNGTLDYSPEVLCLMYVNGDRDDPNRKTAKCIEEIIRKQSSNGPKIFMVSNGTFYDTVKELKF